ncbi:ABC transporter permease [Tianweitania sp. Rool2]|uniref:ABC transporter permease n=2 Tax=Oryzicola mucosus TaxID=2767425 RepID=A0A8J6U3P9_9HYPH|nr:ABC transporter permease [Oryzicola mucosus]MBD0417163.1 ABC transporter permease [Oryzicola mucosus]
MGRFFKRNKLKRAAQSLASVLVTLLLLVTLTFFLGQVMPVDVVSRLVGPDADQATYQATYERLGLDQPIIVQFGIYISRMVQGDFGTALLTGHQVLDDIIRVFPATVELGTLALLIGAGIGVPLGVLAAVQRNRSADHIIRIVTLLGHSVPIFWIGLMGLLLFYSYLGWVGGGGRVEIYYEGLVETRTGLLLVDSLLAGDTEVFWSAVRHIILPATVLGYASMASLCRLTRSFMIDQLSQEYITAARVKGVSEWNVVWHHAFRNIRVQLLTVIALTYGSMLEGAVLIETIFAWPGFGQYLTNNLLLGDMNAIMVCVLLVGVIFITLNMLADLLYKIFDPRTVQ